MSDEGQVEITEDDIRAALGDIAEVAPNLIEYILTYYPPELMMHVSSEIWQRLEVLKKSSSPPEKSDS